MRSLMVLSSFPVGTSQLLKQQLTDFVLKTDGFSKHCYGEIMFKERGFKSTFSPYVTVESHVDPASVWKLLTQHWRLGVPEIVISVAGSFQQHDHNWEKLAKHSWIITSGSSPFFKTVEACAIAVIPTKAVFKRKVLYSSRKMGLFPARYQCSSARLLDNGRERHLDKYHNFHIFVEGDETEASRFRSSFLSFLAAVPVEMDVSFTQFATLPVIVQVVSDEADALAQAVQCARDRHLVAVSPRATRLYYLLKLARRSASRIQKRPDSKDRSKESVIHTTTDAPDDESGQHLRSLFKMYSLQKVSIVLQTNDLSQALDEQIIKAFIGEKKASVATVLRLGLAWNQTNIVKQFMITSCLEKKMNHASLSSLLLMALELNRPFFLQHFFHCGLNIFPEVKVELLWTLYYKALFDLEPNAANWNVIRKLLNNTAVQHETLLHTVGSVVSELCGNEVPNIYARAEWTVKVENRNGCATPVIMEHTTYEHVKYPERDLIIWCVLAGRDEMAKAIWYHSKDVMGLALLASTIYNRAAAVCDEMNYDYELIDKLREMSSSWEEAAIKFVTTCFKKKKHATISLLTARIPALGGCSSLCLGFKGNKQKFMSQTSVHVCLDQIWHGRTNKGRSSLGRTLLAIFFPFLIPCLGIMDPKHDISIFNNQMYHSTYGNDNESYHRQNSNLSADGSNWSFHACEVATPTARKRKGTKCGMTIINDFYDFYNSPRVSYITHSIVLIFVIAVLSSAMIVANYRQTTFWDAQSQIVFWYMVGSFADEVRQIFSKEYISVRTRFKIWLFDSWNVLDIVMIFSFFAGLILLIISTKSDHVSWYIGKLFYAVCLIGLYIRALQAYIVSKYFGPKIYMMRQMVKDAAVFMGLMALIFFSYGVITQCLRMDQIDENTTHFFHGGNLTFRNLFFSIFNDVILEPYWQIYGNKLDDAVKPQTNVVVMDLFYCLKLIRRILPTVRTYSGIFRVICTGVYVLLSNILMVNLLVAMFSFTFQNIQENSYTIWSYYRYDVIREFADRPCCPSPLIMINHAVRLVYWIRGQDLIFNPFNKELTDEEMHFNEEFEKDVLHDVHPNVVHHVSPEEICKDLLERQCLLEEKLDQVLEEKI